MDAAKMLNFVTLSIACKKSQHKRLEKPTLQEASYFVLFTDYFEVIRGKAPVAVAERSEA
jgi:hypothetical protein